MFAQSTQTSFDQEASPCTKLDIPEVSGDFIFIFLAILADSVLSSVTVNPMENGNLTRWKTEVNNGSCFFNKIDLEESSNICDKSVASPVSFQEVTFWHQ